MKLAGFFEKVEIAQQDVHEEEKKMKKKVCMLGLALSLSMFGLVACGENSEENNQPTVEASVENNENESTPVQGEETPVDADAENADAENADAENVEDTESSVAETAETSTEEVETSTEEAETSTEEAETSTEEASTTAAE